MSTANQEILAESGASDRPLILEKGRYVPWASRFLRFMDNKRNEGELARHYIDKGLYKRKEIPDPKDDTKTILEPINKMSQQNRIQYYADIKVMNYILQEIHNDIYNSMDACKDTQTMWTKIKRLMQGTDISKQERHSRLMNKFDKFVVADGESLTSVYERNKAVIQDGRVDIQSKNAGYAGNEYDQNVKRVPRTKSTLGKTNVQCYNCNGRGHYAHDCPKLRVRDAKYFREKMLLATKDEAGVRLDEEENDFMLDNVYGDNTLEELNAAVIMIARIQPTDDKSDAEPTYDAESHEKLKTVIHTSVDDQIDSDIIFDDPYVEDNSRQDEHDSNAHD
nr:hypothetical protein [Tanacetum cinerariifolium]